MKKYGILLDAAQHKALKQLALDEGSSMQDICRNAVLALIGAPIKKSQADENEPSKEDELLLALLIEIGRRDRKTGTALGQIIRTVAKGLKVDTEGTEETKETGGVDRDAIIGNQLRSATLVSAKLADALGSATDKPSIATGTSGREDRSPGTLHKRDK